MRQYLLLTFLFYWQTSCCQWYLNEQERLDRKSDSQRVENIKRQLPYLSERQQIDSLNFLSEMYEGFAPTDGFEHAADSMYAYGAKAHDKATASGNKAGMILSLALLGKGALLKDSVTASEKLVTRAISEGNNSSNFIPIGRAYWVLCEVGVKQNDFGKIIGSLKKAIYYYHLGSDFATEAELYEWLHEACMDRGNYEDAFDYCQKSLQIVKTLPQTPKVVKQLEGLFYDL